MNSVTKQERFWHERIVDTKIKGHHMQMNGAHAGRFLQNLQNEINALMW